MAYGCFDINKIWDKNTESLNAELTTGNSFITILFSTLWSSGKLLPSSIAVKELIRGKRVI